MSRLVDLTEIYFDVYLLTFWTADFRLQITVRPIMGRGADIPLKQLCFTVTFKLNTCKITRSVISMICFGKTKMVEDCEVFCSIVATM